MSSGVRRSRRPLEALPTEARAPGTPIIGGDSGGVGGRIVWCHAGGEVPGQRRDRRVLVQRHYGQATADQVGDLGVDSGERQ